VEEAFGDLIRIPWEHDENNGQIAHPLPKRKEF
jgi:hypothetical protein